LAAPIANSDLPRARNPRAAVAVVLGLLAVAALPGAYVFSRYSKQVELLDVGWAAPISIVIGWLAVVFARRGRDRVQLTLGRAGGEQAVRAAKLLGLLGIYLGLTAALALGFFGLLQLLQ
jgi:hypothetical protein